MRLAHQGVLSIETALLSSLYTSPCSPFIVVTHQRFVRMNFHKKWRRSNCNYVSFTPSDCHNRVGLWRSQEKQELRLWAASRLCQRRAKRENTEDLHSLLRWISRQIGPCGLRWDDGKILLGLSTSETLCRESLAVAAWCTKTAHNPTCFYACNELAKQNFVVVERAMLL